MIEVCEQLGA
jgi:replication factor C subunit 1